MSTSNPVLTFSDLYRTHRHAIYSYILYRVNFDRDSAEDITSDVFLKAYRSFASYNPAYAPSTWLYTITRHTLIDYYRAKKDFDTVDIDTIASADDPLFKLLLLETISETEIETALKTLTLDQQTFIKAQFWDGQTAKEIASHHNVSHDAVRKQISRGLARLRQSLVVTAVIATLQLYFYL